jgi:hypothetical protein
MKKLVLFLLLLPTLGKAQTTMVWESKINNIYYHIELECVPKKSGGVFQFTISDPTIGEEIDYWVTGVWELRNDSLYKCSVIDGQHKKEFPNLFLIKHGKAFQYKGKYIEWKEIRTTTQQ